MSHRDDLSAASPRGSETGPGVVARFETIRAQFGDRVAAIDATGDECYADLGERSARLASVLRERGLAAGERCAIMVPRSRDTLALILAILRVGAVYVPLDPAYPRAQLDFIVADCAPKLVIADASTLANAGDSHGAHGAPVDLADLIAAAQHAAPAAPHASDRDDAAYIMYTSGSTGKPKGVIVPHRAILRLVHGQTFTALTPDTRFLNLAPLAFDASTLEIWGPLLNGGCAAIINEVQPSLDAIAAEIARLGATSAWFTAGLFNALADYRLEAFAPLQEVLTGGDVLSPLHVRKVMDAHAGVQVVNGYGPTENTTFSCCFRIPRDEALAHGDAIPIGYAIAGTQAYIVDDKLAPVADGEVGELVVGGDGVALGYLNRPELTAEKFVDDVFTQGAKLYRTGDLVRRRVDGAIDFLGRNDRQIKIAGKRIELDEIEHALRVAPGVADAAVAAFEGRNGKAIAGFVKADAASAAAFVDALRTHLKAALPDYMVPTELRVLPDFPLTPNGKINRKALLAELDVAAAPSASSQTQTQSQTQTPEHDLADPLAAVFEGLLGKPVDRRANFFDLGLRSLDLMRAHAIIARDVTQGLALVDLFRHPNVDALAAHLRATLGAPQGGKLEARRTQTSGAIAVIGMAGRFPGARNVAQLWANLLAGRDCVTHFDVSELEDSFDDAMRRDPSYVKARPILPDVDRFDAGFFGMLAREAALTDPQQRLFLEIAWEAFEDAGYDPAAVAGAVGVFAGTSMNTYFLKHVLSDRAVIDEFTSQFQIGEYQKLVGAGDFVATRTAYKLGLKGPAISVQTACSTSLTAIGLAVENLRAGRCDMALAGGVSITFPQKRGYFYQEGGMGAADGVCRPFDAHAQGTVFGSGAGVVLLKRLEDALADNDPISAVIRGVGMNNDGSDKVGFTAPSVDAQARAIAIAHAEAGIDPATIGYVEAHGTATPLGDPIEFAGLVQAFRLGGVEGGQFCALGSAKANVGHLDAAAGVTGLIAASLALRERTLPPLSHFQSPNPGIDAARSPFYFNTAARAWTEGSTPRRAGVSSFGVGGTNVHVVLEEAPLRERADAHAEPAQAVPQILPISARSAAALERAKANLATYLANPLASHPPLALADVAATLQTGRRAFSHRAVIVAETLDQAQAKLQKGALEAQAPQAAPAVVFMFPGQGAQYPGMGAALYRSEPVYREWIDKGAEALAPHLGLDIRTMLLSDVPEGDDTPHPIRSTIYAQPALFLTEYALAQLWISRGVRPTAMIGHSVGELVAACVAEAIEFEDALRLIAQRGALMQSAEPGAMLVVRLPEAELRATLPEDVDLAAINAPTLSVVAGPFAAIEAFEATLKARDIEHRRLHTSHAFHSRMMSGVVEELAKVADRLTFAPPKIPYVSSVTGQWAASDRPVSGRYWASHCRDVVRFADALATVTAQGKPLLLEIGPGRTLATFATQGLTKDRYQAAIASLPDFAQRERELSVLAEATGRLWLNGATPDWRALHGADARRIALPTYPFEPERHWIDAPATAAARPAAAQEQTQITTQAQPQEQTQAAAIATPASTHAITDHSQTAMAQTAQIDRKPRLVAELASLLTEMSGEAPDTSNPDVTFWDLGYDSLFMGQVSRQLRRRYDVTISFRQIMSDYPTLPALAQFLDGALPPDPEPVAAPAPVETAAVVAAPIAVAPVAASTVAAPVATAVTAVTALPVTGDVQSVIRDQIAAMQSLMTRQLEVLQGVPVAVAQPVAAIAAPAAVAAPVAAPVAAAVAAPVAAAPAAPAHAAGPEIKFEENRPTRFTAYKPGATTSAQMTDVQSAFITDLATRYSAKTATSKSRTQTYRAVLADPRTASGFREEWKELVYPIVAQRSKGSKIWDVDGNEYIDLVNGYGQTAFGHTPDFVVDAVNAQMAEGFAIGPQSPLAGEVAQMFADMTGHERVTFCNTGSEAVMAAMRLARTVTGKDKVVCFDGDYHGQFDEVLVKPGSEAGVPRAFPLAPGIPNSSVGNMVVLPYARSESLEWIKANIDDIAAVLIEPVQSRHPNLRPKEFVQQLRDVTAANESALIVDEVVTGFRVHPAGMQGYWGIKGDMATYGKVVGGGLPVGVLAGSAQYMDALDGGQWQFGDASVPEVPPTFFAGTFVRHPVVLAAMKAVLLHLQAAGPALQETLGARMDGLVQRINTHLEKVGIATRAETFSSWFYISFAGEDRLGSLFYAYMRFLGVHIMEGFPCFLTTSHSDEDIRKIGDAFVEAIAALQAAGILGGTAQPVSTPAAIPAAATAAPTQAPLTEPQKEIWMSAQQSHEASLAFNESFTLELSGDLNEAAFERAFAATVARHDALRAHFSRVGDTMFADADARVPLEQIDLSTQADAHAQLAALVDAEAREVFDLTRAPLARAALVRLEANKWAFVFTAHHIICDGWSINIILRDLQALYAAEVSGTPAELDDVQSFLAFAKAQDEAGVDQDTRDFWMNLHREGAPQLDLPGDRVRPEVKSFNGASTTRLLSADLLKQVKTAASKQGCSLFAALFGAAQVLFGRLAGRDDVVIAAPMAGQSQAGEALLAGHCVNFLPLRVKFDGAQSFAAHMKAVRDHLYDAGDRQNYTYGALVRDLGIKRDFSRLPLTDLQFNLEKVDSQLDMAGVSTRFAPNAKAYSNFDLFLNVIESAQGLRLDCDFNTDVYDESTIQRWLGYYETLLGAIARDADASIATLPLLGDAEIRHLRDELNASQRAYDLTQTTPALIAAQAHKTPDAVAVADEFASLSYSELDARANQIARCLVAAGIAPHGRVAIAMERTAMSVAAMIGVWRAGCAYVPLDMTMPAARLRQILDGAGIAAVLSDAGSRAVLEPGDHRVLELETLLAQHQDESVALPRVQDADAAYVIFTSGSTGQPKGVEIPHRALSNFLLSMAQEPGFTAQDRIVAVTTFSFDISGLELFLPLVTGGQVFVAGHAEVRTGYELVSRLKAQASTALQATPSLWRMLLEAGFKAPQGFKILCGGEPLPRDLADALLATGAEVWNLYGPTETTIWSAAARVQPNGAVVLGAPLANTQLHVLTDDLRLAPEGVTGELWIGGEGLATGYFNRPDLTDAAFRTIAVEGAAPARLYRTGDLAKRLADGALQHLGRRDQQIKLRGFRIEIEDIEAALRKAPGVAAAAVALHTVNDHPRLVGYVVETQQGKADLGEIAAYVAVELPTYMVPTLWMMLDALPQTQNGKLDRKALPVPSAGMVAAPARQAQATHATLKAVPQTAAPVEAESAASEPAALTPTQATLVSIWSDVLGVQQIGIDQPFFSLGADSLQLFRIVARMNERGLGVDARQLMKNVSIAQLAASLDGAHVEAVAEVAAVARPSILNFKRRNAGGM